MSKIFHTFAYPKCGTNVFRQSQNQFTAAYGVGRGNAPALVLQRRTPTGGSFFNPKCSTLC